MLYFINDYSEGAHEKVLQHLIDTNMEQLAGYGMDHYCEAAKEKIKKACGCEDAEVFLLTGGTQTNQIVIDTMLQPYEGVVAAQTGHVSTHEAGAIEFTGHKVLTLPEKNGKIRVADLKNLVETFYGDENHEHMVFPGLVYISHPTEYGTLYTKKELTAFFSASTGIRQRFEKFVMENYKKVNSVKEFADLYYVSERSFSRKFHSCFGESPYKWMQKKRAEQMLEMICDPELSFQEISGRLGFSSPSHFTAYCRRMYGMSPTQLREKNKK